MGKVTLAVLVAAIALGVYWFWWYDQGANKPITVEGTISVAGMAVGQGMAGSQKMDFTLQAVPGKLRVSGTVQGERVSAIMDLSKRTLCLRNESKKKYAIEEFEFVDMAETKAPEEMEGSWPEEFERTADWEYIGTGDGKWFCNKQTAKTLPGELSGGGGAPGVNVPGLQQMAAMFKTVSAEMWFTPDTRLGKRYFSMLNKLSRIRVPGQKAADKEKRPQIKYVNLSYFPLPMKAVLSFGPARLEMDVKRLSRERIPKDVFEIKTPSGYEKVGMENVAQ